MTLFNRPTMRALLGISLIVLSCLPGLSQTQPAQDARSEREQLQQLLDDALLAIENDNQRSACGYRAEALKLLDANYERFESLYPRNNWGSLQRSLKGSVDKCVARKLL